MGYQQHLQVSSSPKARPVFIDGGAGGVQVGAGSIKTPQAAQAAFAQFIPAPTSQGMTTAVGVNQVLFEVDRVAATMSKQNTDNEIKLNVARGQEMINSLAFKGADGKGGILTKRGFDYINGMDSARTELHAAINASAGTMEDRVAAGYTLGMQNQMRVLGQQMNAKYLVEYKSVDTAAKAAAVGTHTNDAVASISDSKAFPAHFMAAYEAQADLNGAVSDEDRANGVRDQQAFDEVYLKVAEASLVDAVTAEQFISMSSIFESVGVSAGARNAADTLYFKDLKERVSMSELVVKMDNAEVVEKNKTWLDSAAEQVSTAKPSERIKLTNVLYDSALAKGKAVYDELVDTVGAYNNDETNRAGQQVYNVAVDQALPMTETYRLLNRTDATMSDGDLRALAMGARPGVNDRAKRALSSLQGTLRGVYTVENGYDYERQEYIFVKDGDPRIGQYNEFLYNAHIALSRAYGKSTELGDRKLAELRTDLRDPAMKLGDSQSVSYASMAMPGGSGLLAGMVVYEDGTALPLPTVFTEDDRRYMEARPAFVASKITYEGSAMLAASGMPAFKGKSAESVYWTLIASAERKGLRKRLGHSEKYNGAVRKLNAQIDYLKRLSTVPGGAFYGSTDNVQ
ncbi:MAG: hypothetical protein DRJ03_11490 [Chloroflexi bacterium]|nr:MAG: hypothetical protein DRJ03_11490 [Chloroflexota bacterium]